MSKSSDQLKEISPQLRLAKLQAIGGNRAIATLSLERLRQIDRKLSDHWGIEFHSGGDLSSLLPLESDDPQIQAYWRAHQNVEKSMSSAEVRRNTQILYDCIATEAVLGPVTSQRRALILDAAAVSIALSEQLGITGPILDIGCHAGFMASLLADELPNEIQGIDPCRAAIEMGQAHPATHDRVKLHVASLPWRTTERFELILSISSMPVGTTETTEFLRHIGELLLPGGVAIVVSINWIGVDVDRLRAQLKAAGLGFAYADVVGGYMGLPPKFETDGLVVLVKGATALFPRKVRGLMESEWASFRDYANRATTPPREKTQSFERAQRFPGRPKN